MLVIASHLAFLLGFSGFYNVGDLGVRVFFVISGFLITGLLIEETDGKGKIDLLKFYFRRTLRIFPPYYFFLLVFVLMAIAGKAQISVDEFIPVFTYTSNYFFPGDWNLDHAWSLAVEEQFYLIYPGFLVLFGRRTIESLLSLSLFVCPVIRFVDYQLFSHLHPIWMTKGFHANVDTLAIGCLLALKHDTLHKSRVYQSLLRSRVMFAMPVLLFILNAQIDYAGLNLGILFSINNVLIVLIVDWTVTHYNNVPGRILNSRPFVTIGLMSYSIYLWQQPFLVSLAAVIERFSKPGTSSTPLAFPFSLFGFAVFFCISYFLVEKYSQRLRSNYEKVFFKKRPELAGSEPIEA
jgi:peptidoglycan/LPS O-acetylase OafA/YrhL